MGRERGPNERPLRAAHIAVCLWVCVPLFVRSCAPQIVTIIIIIMVLLQLLLQLGPRLLLLASGKSAPPERAADCVRQSANTIWAVICYVSADRDTTDRRGE